MNMRATVVMLLACAAGSGAAADIFEHQRPADTALREALMHDRGSFYLQTPAVDAAASEQSISNVRALDIDGLLRPQGLDDLDRSFDLFLREQLLRDRNYQTLAAGIRPSLLLLEYSSPVMADVIKHYRVSAYERLAIEQARLLDARRAAGGEVERLSSQSELECLRQHEARGLVEAMRLCRKTRQPFDSLVSVDGQTSLQDGRRRIHVVAQALARLGFEKSRIERIIAMAGDRVISDGGMIEVLPKATFEGKVVLERQAVLRQWRDAWKKFLQTGRVGIAALEGLSLAGVPVTARTFADLVILDDDERDAFFLKLASVQALWQVRQQYQEAAGYLGTCARDPALNDAFRSILLEKSDALERVVDSRSQDGPIAHKELLAAAAEAADAGRMRRQRHGPASTGLVTPREMLVNF